MRKLRDRRGITLTEMLCTVLIVLLLTALLSSLVLPRVSWPSAST